MNSATVERFWRLYRQLPDEIRQAARAAYRQFETDPAHPGLHFHRLQSYPDVWSVRITRNYRAVGLLRENTISSFWIGNHEEFDHTFRK